MLDRLPILTWKVNLPGGQARLREAVLFVSKACSDAKEFGLIKLIKIIWRADFEAFARRGVPVTGRQYQRLEHGPAAIEMLPVLNDLRRQNDLTIEKRRVIDFPELRPVALRDPNMRFFSKDDVEYIEASIHHYWSKTGRETSDESHGIAWRSRNNGEAMPYESAYFSDEPLDDWTHEKLTKFALDRNWTSQ